MPCKFDYVLRTERLIADWLDLLTTLQLPLYELPHSNPTVDRDTWPSAAAVPPDRAVFDAEVLEIIHELDAPMFDVWGYARRTAEAPFELGG